MSVQIFLEGKLLGIDEFLLAPAGEDPDQVFLGRSHWISLLSEVLPRALLAELGLAKILLGSSGGGQFLLVLPEEFRDGAQAFLEAAAAEISSLSGGVLKLLWSITENLGDWSDVRRRLHEGMSQRRGAPSMGAEGLGLFEAASTDSSGAAEEYFIHLAAKLREAESTGWSPEHPGRPLVEGGKHSWSLTASTEALPLARHAAPSDDGSAPASTEVLAARSAGLHTWGVLRGDVDNFGIIRIRRAQVDRGTHPALGAAQAVLRGRAGGDLLDAGVLAQGNRDLCGRRRLRGVWRLGCLACVGGGAGAPVPPVRGAEPQGLSGTGRQDHQHGAGPGLRRRMHPLGAVFEEAGRRLEAAKSSDKDCIWLLGRTLEWKQFEESAGLKDSLMRMIAEFGCSPQYLRDLCGIYRETQSRVSRRQARRTGGERPWRYHRRIRRILGAARPAGAQRAEFQKARTSLIADLIGRSAVTVKLRPAGRVALEWARVSSEA